MSKHTFITPVILGFITDEPDPNPTEGASAHGHRGGAGIDPFACSFDTWCEFFKEDLVADGVIDFNDYAQWWVNNGFDLDAWNEFNSGKPFPTHNP